MCGVPLDDWTNGGSADSRIVSMVLVLCGFKEEIMVHCFREVKCRQDYTPRI